VLKQPAMIVYVDCERKAVVYGRAELKSYMTANSITRAFVWASGDVTHNVRLQNGKLLFR